MAPALNRIMPLATSFSAATIMDIVLFGCRFCSTIAEAEPRSPA
jgi:hypothetical protein